MINSDSKRILVRGICGLFVCLSISGCAGEKAAKKDAFLDEWHTAAKVSQGHSPSALSEGGVISGEKAIGTDSSGKGKEGETPVKSLPAGLISLKIRQVDVKTVLRTLGRIAGQNILIKNDIKGEVSIDFKDVPWNDAFKSILNSEGLSYTWEGEILRVMSIKDMENELKFLDIKDKMQAQDLGARLLEPMFTSVININYTDAKELKENLQEVLTKDKDGKARGFVRVDEGNNALIIQAIRDDLAKMLSVIKTLDRPIPQILIKASIVETTSEVARDLGIRWGGAYSGKYGGNNFFITPGGTGGSAVSPGSALSGTYTPSAGNTGISGQGFAVNFPAATETSAASLGLIFGTIGGDVLEMQLNTLQKDGKLNILSSPSITTLDNQKAFTETGEKVPFVTTETTGTAGTAGGTAGGTTVGSTRTVKFENAVLRLEIVPHVIDGKNLKMKILVQKDEVDMARTVEGNPFILKKHTETSLIVQDGETIVISGLTKKKSSESNNGVPGLKDIPFLGWLFKNSSKSETMEDVIIFITPHILPPQVAGVGKEDIGR
ncbi:MAG: type IV pilus secretin PilQ [Nitrospira sp.]|nr:type IV pilus secretin PilQ [Nitrospira sp.]